MANDHSPPVSPVSDDGNQTYFSEAHDLRLRLEDMAHVMGNPEVATAAGDDLTTIDIVEVPLNDSSDEHDDDGPGVKAGLLFSRTGLSSLNVKLLFRSIPSWNHPPSIINVDGMAWAGRIHSHWW